MARACATKDRNSADNGPCVPRANVCLHHRNLHRIQTTPPCHHCERRGVSLRYQGQKLNRERPVCARANVCLQSCKILPAKQEAGRVYHRNLHRVFILGFSLPRYIIVPNKSLPKSDKADDFIGRVFVPGDSSGPHAFANSTVCMRQLVWRESDKSDAHSFRVDVANSRLLAIVCCASSAICVFRRAS